MKIARFIALALDIAGKKSPAKLLSDNEVFLRSFPKCAAVLDKLAAGKMFPTPAYAAVMSILPLEKDPVSVPKVKVAKAPSSGKVRAVKAFSTTENSSSQEDAPADKYTIVVYDYKEVVAEFSAALYQDAERKAFNRLIRCSPNSYAIVSGLGTDTKVLYAAAFKAIFGERLGGKQQCTSPGKGQGKLTSPARVKNYVAVFSAG